MIRGLLLIVCGLALAAAPLPAESVPRPSPEYVIKLTTGEQMLLSKYRGKVVALAFLTTECPACHNAAQILERLNKEYGPKGFQAVAVAFNDMAVMLVPDFVKRMGLTYPVGHDSRNSVFTYLQRSPMLRTYVPILVFIDRQGVIRGQHLGDDNFFSGGEKSFRAAIEELLKEPAGARRTSAQAPR